MTLHTRGTDDWDYWARLLAGLKLICGARIHYSFCNAVEPVLDSDKQLLGLDHAGSTGIISIEMGEPVTVDARSVDPVTHIKLIKKEE